MTVTFNVGFLSALLTPFLCFMYICIYVIGVANLKGSKVIFQVIRGDFWTAIIGICLAITEVLCVIEKGRAKPGRFQTMTCSKVSDQRNSKQAVHFKSANQCFGPMQRR